MTKFHERFGQRLDHIREATRLGVRQSFGGDKENTHGLRANFYASGGKPTASSMVYQSSIAAAARASIMAEVVGWKRARARGSRATSSGKNFSATKRRRGVSSASYTTPLPPPPIFSSTR